MLYKLITGVLLTFLSTFSVQGSVEWNDTIIGHVGVRGNEVVLAYKSPCPAEILEKIPKKHRADWGSARFLSPAGELSGCWKPHKDAVVFIWSDGSYGWMFQHEFRLLRTT